MNLTEHHLLSLGLLAKLYCEIDHDKLNSADPDTTRVIEDCIEEAQGLGLPVSVQNLKRGLPIGTVSAEVLFASEN